MSVKEMALNRAFKLLPDNLKPLARKLYYRDRHWAHPALKKFGTVQDLYYWVADGNLDTLLLLQNYFSFLYPSLNTETKGTISLYGKSGSFLGVHPFSLAHFGCARFRVFTLLEELRVSSGDDFGTLEINIAIPRDVLDHVRDQKSVYFWDRLYIGYTNAQGYTCFVHGLDKTHIYREGESDPIDWYKPVKDRQWAPETPVDIDDYERFNVIMVNRTSRNADVTLILSDTQDNSLSWSAEIPSKGVHRFELTEENTAGLSPKELRMRVKGMASQFGRPVVFKEFPNGAISAMHC